MKYLILLLAMLASTANADWKRDDTTIAWQSDGRTLWQFSFDPRQGKPFFHPLSAGHASLTNFRPEDHPWHYGLWFSWKYINGVNYWEEDRQSGKASGATRWSIPQIEARADGSASIRLDLSYVHPSGRVDLHEKRELRISAPDANGGYAIDWHSTFTAGEQGAVLDRTAMPGEPEGKVNGGYAGLSVRVAGAPIVMSVVTPAGAVTKFESDRARPAAKAIGANFTEDGNTVGALAVLSDAANMGEDAAWYIVNSAAGMRFICAAVLAPRIRTLAAGAEWSLRYRIAVQRALWTPATLNAASQQWRSPISSPSSAEARKQ